MKSLLHSASGSNTAQSAYTATPSPILRLRRQYFAAGIPSPISRNEQRATSNAASSPMPCRWQRYFVAIATFLLTILPATAVKLIDVNPINLAVSIVEKTDSARIQKDFAYYGYTLQGNQDGYKVMRTPTGNEIRYTNPTSPTDFPTVIVKFTENQKQLDSLLRELRFQKEGNAYRRLSSKDDRHNITCTIGSSNTLIIKCVNRF